MTATRRIAGLAIFCSSFQIVLPFSEHMLRYTAALLELPWTERCSLRVMLFCIFRCLHPQTGRSTSISRGRLTGFGVGKVLLCSSMMCIYAADLMRCALFMNQWSHAFGVSYYTAMILRAMVIEISEHRFSNPKDFNAFSRVATISVNGSVCTCGFKLMKVLSLL